MNGQGMVGRVVSSALATSGVGALVLLATAAPAFAAAPGAQAAPGGTLSSLEVIGIFVGIPVGMFALITLLVVAPSLIRDGAKQPALSWSGQPEWFGAKPVDASVATDQATAADELGPSGSDSARTLPDAEGSDTTEESPRRGGAGGRW